MQRLSILLIFSLFFLHAKSSPIAPSFNNPECPPTNAIGSSGYIKSPNFPRNYSNQMDCTTKITVEEGKLVQLIFYTFETELGADVVSLYDGFGSSKKEIVELSGSDVSHTVYRTTESNVMSVKFTSDLDNTYNGYFGFFQGISPEQRTPVLKDCSQNMLYRDSYGVLVSPLWPSDYPNQINFVLKESLSEAYCLYTISLSNSYTHINIRVNYFNTEPNADILMIYQGSVAASNLVKTMSGDEYSAGYSIPIMGNAANIVFVSDLDNRFPGFSLTYTAN